MEEFKLPYGLISTQLPPSSRSTKQNASLHLKTMKKLQLKTGSWVWVGKKKQLASSTGAPTLEDVELSYLVSVWPANLPENQIGIDSNALENIGLNYGEQVFIYSSSPNTEFEFIDAKKVVLEPLELISIDKLLTMPQDLLKLIVLQQLNGYKLLHRSILSVTVYGVSYSFRILIDSSDVKDKEVFSIGIYSEIQFSFTKTKESKTKELKSTFKISYDEIGGLNEQIEIIKEIIELTLINPLLSDKYGIKAPKGMILYGPSGTGKTMLAKAIANESGINKLIIINGPDFLSSFLGESEAKLRKIFEEAQKEAPSIIFIDELDAICPKRDIGTDMEKRIVATLLTLMDGINSKVTKDKMIVIGATNRIDSIDQSIRRPGRFDKEIEISIPNVQSRGQILRIYLSKIPNNLRNEEIQQLASITHGYVGADLQSLCNEAALLSIKKFIQKNETELSKMLVTKEDMMESFSKIKASTIREVMVVDVPKITWKDIGGYEHVKQQLNESILFPLKHPEIFKRMNVKTSKGILLYGPPGCSKTLMAKALANQSNFNFISVKGPELYSKWVGESEKAVREVFRKARQASPTIVFFDEIEALFGSRSESSVNVTDRVISQLLTEMNGLSSANSNNLNVIVLAATNRPDLLDRALLAAGRFDKKIYIGPPDKNARKEIFRINLTIIPHTQDLTSDEELELLTTLTEGFSGADIHNICREAVFKCLEENLENSSINKTHILSAINTTSKSISQQLLQFYETFNKQNSVVN